MNKSFTLGAHTAFLAALLLSLLSVGRTVRSPTLSGRREGGDTNGTVSNWVELT
uniref:Uncharacterized protein n=1 Tax=Nelumbo nucifera TaxID=4432 RepID=A0A822Z6K8_NELNU|nr:TPA_asm: hypothetical protein HUJ06_014536 [Nelumbo nucifera]